MKTRSAQTILMVLMIAALPLVQFGCGGGGDTQASRSGSDGATPASNTDDGSARKKGKDGKDAEKKEEAVPVEIAELNVGPIESILRFSTNLEAESQVMVYSQARRLITALLVEEGNRVTAGQVLVRLQDDEQRSAVSKAQNELEKAQREYKRQERLFQQELISEQEWNDATYNIEQLRISVEDAERELGYTEVKAPIGGTITARRVNLGDQVQISQHLFDIVDFDSIVARIFVPEAHLPVLRQGLVARLVSQGASGRDYTGRVDRIAPVVDPRSGTVKVTVDVGGQPGLRPGMYVDVDLVVATNDTAVLIPKRALVYDNDQMFVFRLAGNDTDRRVERIFIEPRLTDKHFVEAVTGVGAGDRVVIAGQAGLKDGALVKLPGDVEPPKKEGDETAQATAAERASL